MLTVNNNQTVNVKITPNVATPFEFPITNNSDNELVVYLDKVSCSCTTLNTTKTELLPGETKIITGTITRSTPVLFTPQVRSHINLPSEVHNINAVQYSINIEVN